MKTAFTSAACVTPLETIHQPVVVVEGGVITSVGPREKVEVPHDARVVDYGDLVLAPGFLDIHIHGGGGHDVMEGTPEALAAIETTLAAHGTTCYFATTVTASTDRTLKALELLADRIEENGALDCGSQQTHGLRACPLGIHLEGPFISREKRGVHPLRHVREASVELFDRMWQAARGHVKVMTIAPEIAGAEDLIREASGRGVCVSLGHSNACAREARKGFAAGARHVTHIFNAMRPMDHHEPGILGLALTEDSITAEIIADGVHVAPEMVRLFLKTKGEHSAVLVTDAISATGMPDGQYQLGNFLVDVKDNVCLSEGRLAGSVLTLDRAVRNIMSLANWPLEKAVRLATLNPAKTVRVCNRKGVIAAGADADMVALTPTGSVVRTVIAGIERG